MGLRGRYKGAYLGQDHDQGILPQECRFPGHIGTCQDQETLAFRREHAVVGDEFTGLDQRLDHRVPSPLDIESKRVIDPWPDIATGLGKVGKGRRNVDRRKRLSDLGDPACLVPDRDTQRFEDRQLQC